MVKTNRNAGNSFTNPLFVQILLKKANKQTKKTMFLNTDPPCSCLRMNVTGIDKRLGSVKSLCNVLKSAAAI